MSFFRHKKTCYRRKRDVVEILCTKFQRYVLFNYFMTVDLVTSP